MLHNTIFPDIFNKIIHAPRDTIQYFIDFKQAHNSVEKEAIMNEFGKNQHILMDMKQKANDIIQYHQTHPHDNVKLETALKQLSKINLCRKGGKPHCQILSQTKFTTGQIKPPQLVNPWSHIFHKLLKTWRPSGNCTKLSQRSG